MSDLPTGTVTFLFTDIEGSTRLWEDAEEPMRLAMVRHDEIVDGVVEECHGVNVSPRGEGDSRFIVFPDATEAVTAAIGLQRGLQHFVAHFAPIAYCNSNIKQNFRDFVLKKIQLVLIRFPINHEAHK